MNTIIGRRGFIGNYLAQTTLKGAFAPAREDLYTIDDRDLGHVFYCIGDDSGEVESNLGYLCWLVKNCTFESLTYLSSTRVYLGAVTGWEAATLTVSPLDFGYKFNVIKLAAEQVCLSHPKGKVARLSTIVGLNNGSYLIPGLIRDALKTGVMTLRIHPRAIRDIIAIEDVAELLPRLQAGEHRIYNVASGDTTTTAAIVSAIEAATGAKAVWQICKPVHYPRVSIDRITDEFGFKPRPALSLIPALCQQFDDVYIKQILV